MAGITLHWRLHDKDHRYKIGSSDEVVIGRRDECDVVLPFATISRKHALVYSDGPIFYIRNLSRTNTIKLNGDLRLSHEQTAVITPGSVISLGPVELTVSGNEDKPNDSDLQNKKLKIRCSNCGQITDYNPESFCPWCGISLAGSQTIVGME